jgi:hypothetical protein
MPPTLTAAEAIDRYFLEARAKLLDLAAIFDRIDRGGPLADPRLDKLRRALDLLKAAGPGRAEAVQRLFSLDYDPKWERPRPAM